MFARIEDSNFSGEVFSFKNDGWGKVCQWSGIGYFPMGFHGLGGFTEEGLVAFATNQTKIAVVTGLFVDDR